jgi:GH35 family endo-1,4-beta-xylanase
MRGILWRYSFLCASVLVLATSAQAQTTVNGNAMAIRSVPGLGGGPTDFLMSRDGYEGTYVTLAQPGSVTLSVNASGVTNDATLPNLQISVDDSKANFAVAAGNNDYTTTVNLPAGTHFIRTDFNNQQFINGGTATLNRQLTIHNLKITDNSAQQNNVTLQNQSTDALALAASDTYIANYRRGQVSVQLPGVAPGTQVQVDMKRLGFDFGGGIGQFASQLSNTDLKNFLTKNFNMLVPENAGKWGSQEFTQGNVNTSQAAGILNFAAANNMDARQHNLIWSPAQLSSGQQPTFVQNLITSAAAGDANAAASLRTAISNRINYYTNPANGRYSQVDVLNESLNAGAASASQNTYWHIFGPSGIASIYNEMNQKMAANGQQARSYTNDYNVLQFGDSFGGSYLQNIAAIENGDNDPSNGTVGGIGIEYYVAPGHSATRAFQAIQNLSMLNLPLSLTEFGENASFSSNLTTAKQVMNESMRLFFGNPQATSFVIWGWSSNLTDSTESGSVLVDGTYKNLTPMGQLWQDMLGIQDWDGDPTNGWSTHLTATVGADGTINFNGYYGQYGFTINGQTYSLDLTKGTTNYVLAVPEPCSGAIAGLSLVAVLVAGRAGLIRRYR